MPLALPTTLPQPGRIWTGRRAAGPTPGEHRPGQWVPGGECAWLSRGGGGAGWGEGGALLLCLLAGRSAALAA